MSKSPVATLTISPVAITFDALNAPCINKFPELEASNNAQWLTVPQAPVAALNSIVESLLVVPLDALAKVITFLE